MYQSFLIHLSADGHLGCLHVLVIINCCNEHWGTRVSFSSGFLGVYAQQWDFWVIRQFYFQFCKESPHQITSPGLMQDTGCLGLVHWDNPEGWYGEEEGGGFRVGNTCISVVDSF